MKRADVAKSTIAFDWALGFLAVLMVGGIVQDGWAHGHGKVDESFLTPWHAILYGTMALNGLVLLGVGLSNWLMRGYSFRNAIPYGYWLSAIGVIVFLVGGLLDFGWHTLFGVESDINALVSPTHLMLAAGAACVFSGPIRSIAYQFDANQVGWRNVGPAVLAVTAMLTLVGFFTQYALPISDDGIATVMARSDEAAPVHGLYVMNADGSAQRRLLPSKQDDLYAPAVSPDGRYISYRVNKSGTTASDIYVARLDGSGARRITHTGRHDTQPAWSNDGKWIAFMSAPAGTTGEYQLDVLRPDGSGIRTILHGVTSLNGPAWSPDDSVIAVGSRNGTTDEIEAVSVNDGTARWLASTANGSWPAWSHDGKLIAFGLTNPATGMSAVGVTSATGGSAVRVIGADGLFPAWSSDGKHIAYVSTRHGTAQILVADTSGRDPVDVTQLSGMDAERPAWTPRGQIVYVASGRPRADQSNYAQALALSGVLIQSMITVGAILLIVRRWRAPVEAITLLLTVFASAMATQSDDYFAVGAALVAGIAADVFVALLGERARRGVPFYALGFAVPAVMWALYIVVLNTQRGLGWPENMIYGSPIIAGVAGLMIAFAFDPPLDSSAHAV